jgi:hypothetical protein
MKLAATSTPHQGTFCVSYSQRQNYMLHRKEQWLNYVFPEFWSFRAFSST